MEYTILGLAKMSGVSTRTLRYYDELNLLKPHRISSSGYRIYGQKEVCLLQQILFYRELGMELSSIREILYSPGFGVQKALESHREKLFMKREQLSILIQNVEKTLLHTKGEINMSDKERFEGFKQTLIDDNEKAYGQEIRSKYGDAAVDQSNRVLKNMTEEEYAKVTALNDTLIQTLLMAYKSGDPAGELAQKAAALHREWLSFYWGSYSKDAHKGVAQMYVDDPRFTEYYDKHQPGLAEFLRDAVLVYTRE